MQRKYMTILMVALFIASVSFTLTASLASAATVYRQQITMEGPQSANVGDTITFVVTKYNCYSITGGDCQPIGPGARIQLTSSPTVSYTPQTQITDPNGRASFSIPLSRAGTFTFQASLALSSETLQSNAIVVVVAEKGDTSITATPPSKITPTTSGDSSITPGGTSGIFESLPYIPYINEGGALSSDSTSGGSIAGVSLPSWLWIAIIVIIILVIFFVIVAAVGSRGSDDDEGDDDRRYQERERRRY